MRPKKWRMAKTPVETLRKTMDALGMDAEELAVRGLLPLTRTRQVLDDAAPITRNFAYGLERAIGETWPWWGFVVEDPLEP